MRARLGLSAMALTAALVGCSIRNALDPESGLRISIEDPHGRLGPSPWTLAAFNPYLGPDRAFAERARGAASPGKPFVALRRADRDVWSLMDLMPGTGVEFGLMIPALSREGYWLVRFDPPDPRLALEQPRWGVRRGGARFCRWGRIVPEPGGESLPIEAREVEKDYGLELAVVVRMPAAAGAAPR